MNDVNTLDAEVIIIGAGPAGSACAIHLASRGRKVTIIEQHEFPRDKVCGECMPADALALLDDLGVGAAVRAAAGPEITHAGWIDGHSAVLARMPRCGAGPYAYGRALGRHRLDVLLLERARALGAHVIQPARVRMIRRSGTLLECELQRGGSFLRAPVIIDAHGSWEQLRGAQAGHCAPAKRGRDLFAFKAKFSAAKLDAGVLPVLAFAGGYGGLVITDDGLLTLAGCIRRDVLRKIRARAPAISAAAAFEAYVRAQCPVLDQVLSQAQRESAWLAVGPLRTGAHAQSPPGVFKVGNAACESHPLIGEGIHLALQSAAILSRHWDALCEGAPRARSAALRNYQREWRRCSAARMRRAALLAHLAMHPTFSRPVSAVLRMRPALISLAARLAGKARGPFRARASALA